MQSQEIPVASCRPSPTARAIQHIKVEVLARSIQDVGLRQPINVRAVADGFEIRGGGHRHAAFVKLGLETIPAFVRDDDDLHAELAEIDENLCRNDLTPIERDIAVARRKGLYELLHPETINGATGKARAKVRQVGEANEPVERFTKATAEATGQSERAIQRSVSRVNAIGEDLLAKAKGTILDVGEELEALKDLTPERREAVIERAVAGDKKASARTELSRQRRDGRIDEIAAAGSTSPLPTTEKFNVFYADPPWRFDVWSEQTGSEKSPENHYPTLTNEEICNLPVGDMVAENALLFLWITSPRLFIAPDIFRLWGRKLCDDPVYGVARQPWTYCSHYVWDKERIATGYWNRNRHEILLIAKMGNVPRPMPGDLVPSCYREASTVHSRKPLYFAELIERYYPALSKIELFSRCPRPGWKAWGNEAVTPHTGEIIDTREAAE